VKLSILPKALYRTINKHSWITALFVSVVVHGAILVPIFLVWSSASSKGQGPVMLLEAVHEQTQIQVNTSQRLASASSPETQQTMKESKLEGKTKQAKPALSKPQPKQVQQVEAQASASNKGALIDQSGKSPTPEDSYKLQLLKHLTNKMEGAPINGNAIINLTLIPQGIAININVEVKDGGARYKQWVQHKVLSANPFPPIPKELGGGNFTTNIYLFHEPDE
jgi:outer membrane biosynthesis protein TonB